MDSESLLEQFDFSEIQEVMEQCTGGLDITFGEIVECIMGGNWQSLGSLLVDGMGQALISELSANRMLLIQALAAAAFSALFTTFSSVFRSSQIAENGFLISYLFLVSLVTSSVVLSVGIATSVLQLMISFMQAFIPAFALALTITTGSGSALIYYQTIFMICYGVEYIMNLVVIPLIEINVLLCITNHITKDEVLGKLEELSETAVDWILKTMLALVLGIQVVQNLIVPILQTHKVSLVQKAISAIPGIGDGVEAVSGIVLGTGVLIQNAIGVGALLILVFFCLVPVAKLGVTCVLYRVAAALIQPAADKRMVETLDCAGKAAKYLLKTVVVCCVLLFITVALICAAITGIR